MKRNWELDELIEYFTFTELEYKVIGNKTGVTRLGFSVMFKFFQNELRFPYHKNEVSKVVVEYIAKQLNLESLLYVNYDFNNRSATYHRLQIREYFGFREITLDDIELLKEWLKNNVLNYDNEIDYVKELDFTKHFKTSASRETLDRKVIQKRLLLALYSLGTNAGMKRITSGDISENYNDILYIRRKFINRDNLRNAIVEVVNGILKSRTQEIWGEGTTSCASDSKKFSAYDQNLKAEWHVRYHGRGVMIYWHVEKNSTCIYSQLKSPSSSEVSSMLEGLLKHRSDAEIEKIFTDSHGQSEVAFAFCYLLGFSLMPRLKAIYSQKLYMPDIGITESFPNLQSILTRPINWEIIRQQYDQMVKYATALRLGTGETESILKIFTKNNLVHPTYKALSELGKAVKTIFLCEYLKSENMRREINEGLNVIENWNSANNFIFYGKGREITTNSIEDQEITALSLHLLQNCLVYINTLMIQKVLSEKKWYDIMTVEDFRGLTPLIYAHVNPYGSFKLDMDERIVIGGDEV